jgi:hypothetical protein
MSQEARVKAQETGELPHEFLLRVMRGEDIDGNQPEFKDRMAAAVAAAPYYAPKLSSVDHKGETTHRMVAPLPTGLSQVAWQQQFSKEIGPKH